MSQSNAQDTDVYIVLPSGSVSILDSAVCDVERCISQYRSAFKGQTVRVFRSREAYLEFQEREYQDYLESKNDCL